MNGTEIAQLAEEMMRILAERFNELIKEKNLKLNEDEFNFTTNPTIRKNNNLNADLPKDFVANSEFAPYITTIGLYDQYGQLLAVGKLGTPIKKRDNVDTTFVVRFDI